MKTLIVATSAKPPNFEDELREGKRYRLEYIELSEKISATFVDYDPPWMHTYKFLRHLEEKTHMDFFWAWQIARKVRREQFDVVLSMSERMAVPLGLVLDRRVKHIAILINALSPKWLFVIKRLNLHKRWHHMVTYSHAEAIALQKKLYFHPDKITPILNYVDTDFFSLCSETSSAAQPPFFLSQGLAKRDYPTLIRAMQTLPDVACHISAVSAWDDFKAGYEGMTMPENVTLKAYNHPSLIKDMMAQCEFLVIPLQHDVGMWCSGSTSVLQAQAMGKPVIVTYLPGIAEYVRDGETGILVKGNNPAAMANAIRTLWEHPDRTESMGHQARIWVRNNFSLDNWIENITTLIQEVAYPSQAKYRLN